MPNEKKLPLTKCAGCGKFLAAAVSAACTMCPAMYHRSCVGVLDGASLSKDWACPECKKKIRRGDNSATPIRGICGSINKAAAADAVGEREVLTAPAGSTATDGICELRHELSQCILELREFRREMAEHRTLVAGVAARMDGLEQRLDILERREAAPLMPSADVTELESRVAQLRMELDDRDQEALLSDLEIGQLPEEMGENVVHVVTVLSNKLGVTLEDRDIVFAERVGAVSTAPSREAAAGGGTRHRRIVVRLARRSLRDDLLRAARVRRSLTTADVGRFSADSVPPGRIFINERLTRTNRQLFYRAREECRNNHWRYSWTRRGRVFVRRADGAPAFQIRTDADIDRVLVTDRGAAK